MEPQFARAYRTGVLTSALVLLIMLGLSAWAWVHLPTALGGAARFEFIFGRLGPVGAKVERLLLSPLVTLALVLVFVLTPLVEPRKAHLEHARRSYLAVWMGFLAMGALSHVFRVLPTLGYHYPPRALGPVSLGLIFMVFGNYLAKTRSNFSLGIKNRWTLSSERSWRRTNRLAGWGYVVFGLLLVVLGLPGGLATLWWVVPAYAVPLLVGLWLHSYLAWRGDPDKQMLGR
jgi:uncharacterized membrane protein